MCHFAAILLYGTKQEDAPGTLPEELEVKLSEFSCNGRWCLSRRQMEHKSLLKYSLSSEKPKRRQTCTVLQGGEEEKQDKHQHPLCIREKKSFKEMWSSF